MNVLIIFSNIRLFLLFCFQLFGKVFPDDDVISSNNNFKTFGGALMVLFRSATGTFNCLCAFKSRTIL